MFDRINDATLWVYCWFHIRWTAITDWAFSTLHAAATS